jgi:uncharacterized membrane protein YccF (DUF307 family)
MRSTPRSTDGRSRCRAKSPTRRPPDRFGYPWQDGLQRGVTQGHSPNPYAAPLAPPPVIVQAAPQPTATTTLGTLGNLLWILFGGGFLLAVGYAIGALFLCVTIVGIPFGIQIGKLAVFALLPFDKRVVDRRATGASGCVYAVVNLGWFLFFGLGLALSHLLMALLCAVTVIGIPFAVAHVKLAGLALRPFGREVL